MGKGDSGSSSTTVKQELSPEQRKIMQGTMDHYMPGGQFGARPEFDPSQHKWMGEQRTAAFNPDQERAFQETRDTAFAHRPDMDWSADQIRSSATPTGQKQALGAGWSTDPDGSARFRDWNDATAADYMNPYQENVISAGTDEMQRLYEIEQKRVNDAATKAGSFGGSRHGVQAAETAEGYNRQLRGYLADTLSTGYESGRNQYNLDRNEGQEALSWNKGVDDDNSTRSLTAGKAMGDLAEKGQMLDAQGINALGSIGAQQQGREQQVLDTSYDELMNKYLWNAQLGQMLSGFTPAPTQTQNQSSSSGGSIWGSMGSAALQAAIPALMGLSDEDAKTDIEEADPEDALESIRKLAKAGLYTYRYTDEARERAGSDLAPEGQRTGFMAQDLDEATGKEGPSVAGFKGVDVMEQLGRLTHAVAALDKKVAGGEKRAA